MKSIILYSTLKPDYAFGDYQRFWVSGIRVFIRAELFNGDLLAALDAAKPFPGETVLNSIPAE